MSYDIGIIGGADGPTAVLVSESFPLVTVFAVAAVVLIAVVAVIAVIAATRDK